MDNIERTIEEDEEEDMLTRGLDFLNPDNFGNHVVAVISIKGEQIRLRLAKLAEGHVTQDTIRIGRKEVLER